MAGIAQVSGLISGIDTRSLIDQMMALERRPIDALRSREQAIQQRTKALSQLKDLLSTLQNKVFALTQTSTVNAKRVSTDTPSTTAPIVSASAGPAAAIGSFKVTVLQLASSTVARSTAAAGQAVDQNAALQSAGFAITPTSGTFTINGVTITIDASTDKIGDVINKINSSGAGVTASLVNDPDGRPNRLELTSASPIQLGSGADTSNFLTVAKLLAAPEAYAGGTYTRASTGNLGTVQAGSLLQNARLATSLSTSSGSFKINGVEITWDATKDSLNDIISRINASGAKVTASYDSVQDKLVLTAKDTGSSTIALSDQTGNFLASLLQAADPSTLAQDLGQNAQYQIDKVAGGATQTSSSNTITGVIPGLTLNLLRPDPTTQVTVTVQQDTGATVQAVKDFVSAYNAVMDFLDQNMAWDSATKKGGPLMGDSTARMVQSQLRLLVSAAGEGLSGQYTTLASVGVSTGAIGTGSSTRRLSVDESKLTQALTDNPEAVSALFTAFRNTATFVDGAGAIVSITGAPTREHRSGQYVITTAADGTISAVFTPTGGTAGAPVTGTIAAGGTNVSLIPGITLTATSPLVDGTDTIDVTVQARGVAVKLNDYLQDQLASTGVFVQRQQVADEQVRDIEDRIARMEERLQEKESYLVRRFAALEKALSSLQSQSAGLSAQLAALGGFSAG